MTRMRVSCSEILHPRLNQTEVDTNITCDTRLTHLNKRTSIANSLPVKNEEKLDMDTNHGFNVKVIFFILNPGIERISGTETVVVEVTDGKVVYRRNILSQKL